jgi:hypothetical protein
MSNSARRYHVAREQSDGTEDWDKYLDPHWRRKGFRLIQGDPAPAPAHARAKAEARRGTLRLVGSPGGERESVAHRQRGGQRRWDTSRRGMLSHFLQKARGELLLEYPWLDPDYLYYKFIRRT